MEDHRLPKIVIYDELSTGHRNRGAPKKRFKDSLKKSLSSCNIDNRQWSVLATDRAAWRINVHDSVSAFERRRRTALEEKRSKRKNRAVTAPTPDSSVVTYLEPLWPSLPVRHRTCQSPAGVQQEREGPLTIFGYEAKPKETSGLLIL
ncbi:hypothetical protein Bbelb_070180 [Branchiostoma belcheri]|nr:hypothetical protein Bbelb_070180 [Branchiostoma belcheri]